MPEWSQINAIEPSPFDPATAYVAATMYKSDDYRPYMYKTTDYGKTWTKIVNGIPDDHFTRVLREDPNHKGLLFAGTEFGIYVSYDSGDHWQSIQLNLPIVPITDLAFHKRDDELVVATQGRAFWIMDDLALLWELKGQAPTDDVNSSSRRTTCAPKAAGAAAAITLRSRRRPNPPTGAVIEYWLKDRPQGEVTIEFLDAAGKTVNKYSSRTRRSAPRPDDSHRGAGGRIQSIRAAQAVPRAPAQPGMNRFVWDLHYPDATTFPNMILWAGSTRGPLVVPGNYQVKLTVDGKTQTQPFTVVKDPRLKTTTEDFNRQLALALQIRDKLSQTNQAVIDIRAGEKQLAEYVALWKDDPAAKKVVDTAQDLTKKLSAVEEELYQVKNQAHEDPLNYPIRLNNRIAALLGVVEGTDAAPTRQSDVVYEELTTEVNVQLRAAQNF